LRSESVNAEADCRQTDGLRAQVGRFFDKEGMAPSREDSFGWIVARFRVGCEVLENSLPRGVPSA